MKLFVLGVNYEEAPVSVREKFFFSEDKILSDKEIIKSCGVEEFIFLQTCNRNEVYLLGKDEEAIESFKKYYMSDFNHEDVNYIFYKEDQNFIEHIYRVSCGLNSAILGEGEILGQVKNALEFSIKNKTSGKILNKIFREAITFSKKMRNEYKISENQTSIGAIASGFALEKLKNSNTKNIMIVGSGEVGRLSIKYLKSIEGINIFLSNRTRESAEKIAAEHSNIKIVDYGKRYEALREMDFVISATSSEEPIFKYSIAKEFLTKNIHFMDLAVPLDIEAQIGNLDNVILYTVDDMRKISERNMVNRQAIAEIISRKMEDQIVEMDKWLKSSELDSFIKNINSLTISSVGEIKREIEKRFNPTEKEKKKIEKLVESSVKKVFKEAIINLKNLDENEIKDYTIMLSKLFNF